MLSLDNYLVYCALYAVCIAVPGPGVAAMVARALGSGFRSSIPAALGTLVGDLVWMTLSAFGLAGLAALMGQYFLIIKYAGVLYLLYMAFKYWTAEVSQLPEVVPTTMSRSFLSQLSVTLGNPKAMGFFLALFPRVVDLKHLNAAGYLQLVLATAVLIPSIMLSYAALASRVRIFLTSQRARKGINQAAAAAIAGAGLWVAVSE